jgi:hypothetical protein
MANRFASEKKSHGFCDKCAFRYPLKKLRPYVVLGKIINQRVCPTCHDPDHPQLWVGIIGSRKASDDPQALRNPRPDTNLNASRGLFAWNPIATQSITSTLNSVHVTIS